MRYGELAQKNYEVFDLGVDATISFEAGKGAHIGQLKIDSIVRAEPFDFTTVLKSPENPLQLTAKESEKARVFEAIKELFSDPAYKRFRGEVVVYGKENQPIPRNEADWFLRNKETVFSLSAGRPTGRDGSGRPVIEKSEINLSYGWAHVYFYAFQDGAEDEGLYVKLSVSISEDKLLDAFGGLHNIENELRKE